MKKSMYRMGCPFMRLFRTFGREIPGGFQIEDTMILQKVLGNWLPTLRNYDHSLCLSMHDEEDDWYVEESIHNIQQAPTRGLMPMSLSFVSRSSVQ